MSAISENWQATLERVRNFAQNAARDSATVPVVKVLAVSKTFPVADVVQAIQAGARAFGENYVQEGVEKILALRALGYRGLEWHFIGPLQSNKTRLIAEHFDWVHSVDRLKIAQRLAQQRPADLPPLQVCLQVNISYEDSKSGVAPAEVVALAREIQSLERLQLRGLMAIPQASADFQTQRRSFAAVRQLLDECRAAGLNLDTLSMGMSADLEAAIAEGATIVRVGSAIFGQRTQHAQ